MIGKGACNEDCVLIIAMAVNRDGNGDGTCDGIAEADGGRIAIFRLFVTRAVAMLILTLMVMLVGNDGGHDERLCLTWPFTGGGDVRC